MAQLRDWLLTHEDVGDDYKEDIQKLAGTNTCTYASAGA